MGVGLALSFVTLGVFSAVWFVLQAWWARRVRQRGLAVWVVGLFALWDTGRTIYLMILSIDHRTWMLGDGRGEIGLLLFVVGSYLLRWELSQQPIGLSLGWVMPFFFGPLYFQYRIQDLGVDLNTGKPLGLNG